MGFCEYIYNRQFFIAWAFLTRLLQGIAAAFIKVMVYVIAKRLFPRHFQIISELISTSVIVMNGIGPIFSSSLSDVFTFDIVLYIASGLCLCTVLPQSWICLPKERGQSSSFRALPTDSKRIMKREDTLRLYKKGRSSDLSYWVLCKQPLFFVANLQCFVSVFCVLFFIPFLSLKLKNDFNVGESLLGYFFLAKSVGGIFGATPGVFLLRKCFRLSTIIAFGSFTNIVAYLLFSMTPRLGLPHTLALIWCGVTLNGFAFSILYTPILPYVIDYYTRHPIQSSISSKQYQGLLLSKTVSIFNVLVGIAEVIAPFIGGLFYDVLGFTVAFQVISLFFILTLILWFVFGHVCDREEYKYFNQRRKIGREAQEVSPLSSEREVVKNNENQ